MRNGPSAVARTAGYAQSRYLLGVDTKDLPRVSRLIVPSMEFHGYQTSLSVPPLLTEGAAEHVGLLRLDLAGDS